MFYSCSKITSSAESQADKMTPEGCTSYSLTRSINTNKRKMLLGVGDCSSPNLRPRFIEIDGINVSLPISGKFSAVEACNVLINNKGKGKVLINFFIKNEMIPVKKTQIYSILDLYRKSTDSERVCITWSSRGQPKILSDDAFEVKLKKHREDVARSISEDDIKDILKQGLGEIADKHNESRMSMKQKISEQLFRLR